MNVTNLNTEIERLVTEHEKNHRIALESAVKVGLYLIDLKKTFAHGHWEEFADKNIKLSQTVRQNYMKLARYFLATGEYPSSTSLSASIELLSASEEVKLIVKEKEQAGIKVSDLEIKKLKQKIPTAKRITNKVISLRKFVDQGKENEAIEYKQWLEIRDEVSDALDDINKVIANVKKAK